MISVTLQDVRSAKATEHDVSSWVTLTLAGGNRAALHLRTFSQAERIAAIIMEGLDAQVEPHAGAGAHEEGHQ